MKNTIKYTVMAACVSLASMHAWGDQTNLVRNLGINLVCIAQGGSTTAGNVTTTSVDKVKVGTDDIIAAIGMATGVNFSSNADLVVIMPLSLGNTTVAIRDGGNSVDVTPFFAHSHLSEAVQKSTANHKNGKANGSNYSLEQFILQDSDAYQPLGLHYTLSGVAVENFTIPAIPGPRSELSAEVSGTGDSGGNLLIIQGTISITGQTVEVVPGNGGNPD